MDLERLDNQAWATAFWLVLKDPTEEKLSYAIGAYRQQGLHGHRAVKIMEAEREVLRGDQDDVPAVMLDELRAQGLRLGLVSGIARLRDSLLLSK
jgi:hypothetical protein